MFRAPCSVGGSQGTGCRKGHHHDSCTRQHGCGRHDGGGGATVDVGKDRVASDEEFWAAFMREKGAWKETERRLHDR